MQEIRLRKVLDLSSVVMDISVAQSDVALVRPGDRAVIKLDSYPQRTWRGVVNIVSPVAQTVNDERTFAARVSLGEQGSYPARGNEWALERFSLGIGPPGMYCCASRRCGRGRHYGTG